MSSLRVQQANAAVEDALQDSSDEGESELGENDGGDGMAIDDRLPIPASYNRTLLELYRKDPVGHFNLTFQSLSKTIDI